MLDKCVFCEIENNKDLSLHANISVWVDDNIMTVECVGEYEIDGVNIPINYCPMCRRYLHE